MVVWCIKWYVGAIWVLKVRISADKCYEKLTFSFAAGKQYGDVTEYKSVQSFRCLLYRCNNRKNNQDSIFKEYLETLTFTPDIMELSRCGIIEDREYLLF